MAIVTKIPATVSRYTATSIQTRVRRKVAAYARVSTDHEDQLNSYEAQCDYYTTYIQANAKGTGPAMSIATVRSVAASKMFVNVQHGMVSASFTAATTAPAKAMLLNSLGQVIAQQNFTASKGANRVELSSDYRGPAMLMVRQGSQRYMQKVILK